MPSLGLFKSKKSSADEGPAPHQEDAPTGELVGEEAPEVENLGEFNPNVKDYAHVKKGIARHTSMAMAHHVAPKQDKWSHHTVEPKEGVEEMSLVESLKYKTHLYSTMGKLRGDIVYTNFLIKLKKRQFGVQIFDVLEEDGKVGSTTLAAFKEYKAEIQGLLDKIKWNEEELLRLALVGEGESVKKPSSTRSRDDTSASVAASE